jgi:3-isopropylmalate/(R)-2-methylmalate dehydratase small subunit
VDPVNTISGRAVPLPLTNVDTDQIVPARFLYRNRRDGFADTLFHDLRIDDQGQLRKDVPLNRPECSGAQILVSLDNFGCGSSREHAVWALLDSGFRCVIATSFGDIFRNNAIENGLLAVVLPETDTRYILGLIEGSGAIISVDLPAQIVTLPDGSTLHFDFDPAAKENLVLGRGKIDATLAMADRIDRFETDYTGRYPWTVSKSP